ncbi:hypothetical protein DFH28DRAFT_1085891 [Melampsora americana]|nr:hypothetical protein DFH28DRAFT_1085891 [Melampsora americana]
MNEGKRLPLNIIKQILQELVNQLDRDFGCNNSLLDPDLTTSSYKKLIKLRLVSKTWAKALIPFYFQTIYINDSRRAKIFLDEWNQDLLGPCGSFPIEGLSIGKLMYSEEEDEGEEQELTEVVKDDVKKESIPVSMNQLSRLINLFGSDLKSLDITFVRSMGVSTQFIEAIKTIKDLKTLKISYDYKHSKSGTYDLDSISTFFSSIPKLESLSFMFDSLDGLTLEPPALSSLRLFSFTVDSESEGLSHMIETSKQTLKVIEIFSAEEASEGSHEILEPIKDTLEGLFIINFSDQLPYEVTKLRFPKLRVMRTQDGPEQWTERIYWLEVPMLKNLRTMVTDLRFSQEYWVNALKLAGKDALKKVPNFKHIVFTRDQYLKGEEKELNPALVEDFKSRGVQCHVMDEMTCDEIMDLDYKLNGPMK